MSNKVLLADDSITIQKVVGIIFANEDCELTVVDNGDAALEKAREIHPDVMLVDALMPGKTGYEVCTEVRRDPLLRGTPILLMTGAFEPFDEDKARESGADDFISKPFESQQLVDKVKRLLDLGKTRVVEPPVVAPSAVEAVESATPAVVPAAPDAAPVVDDFGSLLDLEEPAAALVETPSPFAVEVEEVSPEDDLWGAFELEEPAEEEAPVEFGEVGVKGAAFEEAGEAASFALEETEDFFGAEPLPAGRGAESFGIPAEEEYVFAEEPVASAAGPEISFADVEPFGALAADEAFITEELPAEEPAGVIPGIAEPFAMPEVERIAPPVEPAVSMAVVEQQFAPEEEYLPVMEPAAPAAGAAPAVAAEGAGTGTVTLSEEQLAAVVARISKEIIEKIAWEVVPDLAETLIKEEIRKIREGR